MYEVVNLRGKVSTACNGMLGYNAEAEVINEDRHTVYVHANWADDGIMFTVSDTSIYDYMTGSVQEDPKAEFSEEYEGIEEAKGSKYYGVMTVLESMINALE